MKSSHLPDAVRRTQWVYSGLTASSTLAASFIWGINTLFLLDAGLSNAQAFASNAFYTLGTLLFEVPTGVVADIWGRRTSYLIGTVTLFISTLLYLLIWYFHAPFWAWAITSVSLGLGFTFFSGATEAWLVDALRASGYKGSFDSVFARGQIVAGIAMLSGSIAGGLIAQLSNLGVPYMIRAAFLLITFVLAWVFMKDLGFTSAAGESLMNRMHGILKSSIDQGLRKRPVRWIMLMAPFTFGAVFYAFYALQPYLLELYKSPRSYGIAGLAAATMAAARILGGILASQTVRIFNRRTTIILCSILLSIGMLVIIGSTNNFWVAALALILWALSFSAAAPIRQAYLNSLIPSSERATVLSFDSLLGSSGGVVSQPALGRIADVYGYGVSYLVTSAIQILALPFAFLARRENASEDRIEKSVPGK